MFPLNDPVCVLLETPFSRWNDNDQKDFLSCEKAMPILKLNKVAKVKDKVYNRNFKKSWYAEFEWLCGSYYLNKLFCVTCLIICDKTSVWNKTGFNDFSNVIRALRKHEGSSEHLRCALRFSKLRKSLSTAIEDASKENSRLYVKQFNENVQLNRRFMQLPIRAVLYLGKQELTFRGHHEDVSSINRGNFKELLEAFISISPVDIQEHYKKIKSVFAGNSKTIQNEIINCISQYIDEYVEKEIKASKFFSVQVDIVQKSECSIIIRYINPDGKLVERFLGFYNVSSCRTAETVFNLVSKCLEKFDYKAKLIGQCFDGASVMSGQLHDLQAKIKEAAPQAVFVHSLAHRLNFLLQQSCNRIATCRLFFATVSGLPSFFHHVAHGRQIPASWTSNSKILGVINNEWDFLKRVFAEIMNDPTSDQASVRQSDGFLNKFNDFEFALLVVVFNDMFGLTDVLIDVLQKKSFDISFCISQVRNTQTLLNGKRNENSFSNIFNLAAWKTLPNEDREGRDEIFEKYKILYYEILDTLSLQMSTRFQDMEKRQFVTLMDNSKFVAYSEKFPTEALTSLKVCYPNLFTDHQRLKNELQLIYSDEQYRDKEQQNFMQILSENSNIFKEAYKLFCLILTIPPTSVSVERGFSCLKRIKTYLRNMTAERLSDLSKISIEQALLNELINAQPFYDDIIDKFASLKDRRIDLIYLQETRLGKRKISETITHADETTEAININTTDEIAPKEEPIDETEITNHAAVFTTQGIIGNYINTEDGNARVKKQPIDVLFKARSTRTRCIELEQTENLLSVWLLDQIKKRPKISFLQIQKKALSIFEGIKNNAKNPEDVPLFLASGDWFRSFQSRYAFSHINVTGEVITDVEAAKAFSAEVKSLIEKEGYTLDQVFNFNEMNLHWKQLPLAEDTTNKDRLSVMLGMNATGDLKLKPAVVYHTAHPPALKGVQRSTLGVHFKHSKSGCMTEEIFSDLLLDVYEDNFREYCTRKNLEFKVLIILNNTQSHSMTLTELSPNIKFLFLPSNTSSIIQPLDQGIAAMFKHYYTKRALETLVADMKKERTSTIAEIWKRFNIKNAIDIITRSWRDIAIHFLRYAWRPLLPTFISETASLDLQMELSNIKTQCFALLEEAGLEVEKEDIEELFESHAEPLTVAQGAEQSTLFVKQLSLVLTSLERGIQWLEDNDYDTERSRKVICELRPALEPYKQLVLDRKKFEKPREVITYSRKPISKKQKGQHYSSDADISSTQPSTSGDASSGLPGGDIEFETTPNQDNVHTKKRKRSDEEESEIFIKSETEEITIKEEPLGDYLNYPHSSSLSKTSTCYETEKEELQNVSDTFQTREPNEEQSCVEVYVKYEQEEQINDP